MPTKRATLRDVAAASGVSAATASFVLNRTPGQTIPVATQERVRRAALELGYTPYALARGLREGASRIVLLTVADIPAGHTSASFIAGMERELAEADHSLVVAQSAPESPAFLRLVESIAPRATVSLAALVERENAAGYDWENGFVAHSLTQLRHLGERGHTRIAIALPDAPALRGYVAARERHLRAAAAQLRLEIVAMLDVAAGRDGAVDGVTALAQSADRPTAIATFDDDTGLRILSAMARIGLSAPGDFAVIGFDNSDHAALWTPSLSTVHIDAASYGARAARAVLGLDPAPWQSSPSHVIEREST